MDINDKKLKRTTKIINWVIALVLGVFLILLSNTIIDDLDSSVKYPLKSEFEDQPAIDLLNKQAMVLNEEAEGLYDNLQNIRKMIDVAKLNKESEQQSFDNWIKTRSTLGSPSQDKEVLQRVEQVDRLAKVEQEWQQKADSLYSDIYVITTEQEKLKSQERELDDLADIQYYKAENSYSLKVFLIRLLFVAPILALGIFFFLRFRNNKFSPLYMGFTFFSVYAFFFGLVPYLPSYGGYIRYSVGILLTVGLGYYAIKKIRAYSDRKRIELKASSVERANTLQSDIVEKAFNNHICPSCGKDFLLKNWETAVLVDKTKLQPASNFCRYCGLELMKNCSNCNHANYAHLPFCVECGAKVKE